MGSVDSKYYVLKAANFTVIIINYEHSINL